MNGPAQNFFKPIPNGILATTLCFLILLSYEKAEGEDAYQKMVVPFTQKYCISCHNDKRSKGGLNLAKYKSDQDVVSHFRHWNAIIEFIRDGEMPPEDEEQPSLEARNQVVQTLEDILFTEAKKHAGDPGRVLPRRLSNTEYDLSVRDLTGFNIRPTRNFPPDPQAGEGFDNTGEALTMSPSLVRKYLSAAKEVSQHLVLTPGGVQFSPYPVTSYSERKKFAESAIIKFYQDHSVHLEDYLEEAWKYRERPETQKALTPQEWAQQKGLSEKYFATLWNFFDQLKGNVGLLSSLKRAWEKLPSPDQAQGDPIKAIHREIENIKKSVYNQKERLIHASAGNWPIRHLSYRAEVANNRSLYNSNGLSSKHLLTSQRLPDFKKDGFFYLVIKAEEVQESSTETYVLFDRPIFSRSNKYPRNDSERERHQVLTLRQILEEQSPELLSLLNFGQHPEGKEIDKDSFVLKGSTNLMIPIKKNVRPQLQKKHFLVNLHLDSEHSRESSVRIQFFKHENEKESAYSDSKWLIHNDSQTAKEVKSNFESFCSTFPSRFFYVDSRRGLAAGFHLVEGFFRDDKPLVKMVLSPQQNKHLDSLWRNLRFMTKSAETLLRGFVWFERAERHVLHDPRFNFLRAEDPKLIESELLNEFERVYLLKMGVQLIEGQLVPKKPNSKYDLIHGFFEDIRQGLKEYKGLLVQAENRGYKDVLDLASKAYRRPLLAKEKESYKKLYKILLPQVTDQESALRGVFTAILMSPHFNFRYQTQEGDREVSPLSSHELASRLSYFLWSSFPDDQLRNWARLQKPNELHSQLPRLLQSSKVEAFAHEFFGQWLKYRDYLTKDPIQASSFKGYDDELKQSMAQEPTHVLTHLIQKDLPLSQIIDGDFTFLNQRLANHYGGELKKQFQKKFTDWKRGKYSYDHGTFDDPWFKVENLMQAGRGGIFGMGVILTKNSAGERTSPIKRGFWTVHHLLGQHFPPPPADVPELPKEEKKIEKSLRELIRDHTEDPSCSLCHVHFDELGFAMEGFDAIGRKRTKDFGGRLIDTQVKFPNGDVGKGIPGLVDYVKKQRLDDFTKNFCRKLLGYALGRSVILSDKPLLVKMEKELRENEYKFSSVVKTIITSRQFLNQRTRERVASEKKL